MKKKQLTAFAIAAIAVATLTAAGQAKQILTKKDGMTVINTTELGKDVRGFKGTTPLNIYIQKGKIVKVEALENIETPKYFKVVEDNVLKKWNGMSTKKAATEQVDGATGATFSSNAVIRNVQLGAEYYNKNSKKK